MKGRNSFELEQEVVEQRIFIIRGQRVMLSSHLAELYGVEGRILIQAVKRNIERFPEDFMFQLTAGEYNALRSQFVISKRGGIRYKPYAFTEQGIAMLSSVLNSKRAIQVNIEIIRTFTKLRRLLSSNEELKRKIEAMERKYDSQFKIIFEAIKQLLEPLPVKSKGQLGFRPNS